MVSKTLGDILRPTKGDDSYPRIANRANAWLRQQREAGRELPVASMSSEQVRRVFEDHTVSPKPIYLEALAAVQDVDVRALYAAAGYSFVENGRGSDPILNAIIAAYRSARHGSARQKMREAAEKIAREEAEESPDCEVPFEQ